MYVGRRCFHVVGVVSAAEFDGWGRRRAWAVRQVVETRSTT